MHFLKQLLSLAALICFAATNSNAQGFSINTTGSPADPSAMLDISSTTKGFVIPRMTKGQRNAILLPANGLLVYQNGPDSIGFHYYNGAVWTWLISNNVLDTFAWSRNGNAGTVPSVNFVGTTDNNPLRFRVNNIWAGQIESNGRRVALGLNAGTNAGTASVTIGNAAGFNNTGTQNVIIGDSAGYVSSQSSAVYIGTNAGRNYLNFSEGYRSVVIGDFAGDSSVASWTTIIGNVAGRRNRVAGNTFVGSAAGENNTTGSGTFIGDNAGRANTTGFNNTFLGAFSGFNNLIGFDNNFSGYLSGYFNSDGSLNTFTGSRSGYRNTSGSGNTFSGTYSGNNNTIGNRNSFYGAYAGFSNNLGDSNVFIGHSAAYFNTTGSYNHFSGYESGFSNSTGSNNTFSGFLSGRSNSTGTNNVAVGSRALLNANSQSNIAIGNSSLFRLTGFNQNYNVAVGDSSAANLTTGANNVVIGSWAFKDHTTGSRNTIIGNFAMGENTNGNDNTALGEGALWNTNNDFNTGIGKWAGFTNFNGTNNTFIGTYADAASNSLINATAIGFRSYVGTDNSVVIGSVSGFNGAAVTANVGIGVTNPTRGVLNIASGTANGTTMSIFGVNNAGISIQQNFPTIGFNQYRDLSAGNASRYMGNGFAWVHYMDPGTGTIFWNSMPSGTANAAGGLETNRLMLTNTGILQFPNLFANRKIVLYESLPNDHQYFGFGIESSGTLRYAVPGTGNAHRFYAGTSASTSNLLLTIFGSGNATLAGTLTQLSDVRLKKNIMPIQNVLGGLTLLNAYTYQWKDENKDQAEQIGLLAQEVEKLFPQLVKKDENGMLGVNYSGFVPVLIEAVKDQQQQIEKLKKENEEMKHQLQTILFLIQKSKKRND